MFLSTVKNPSPIAISAREAPLRSFPSRIALSAPLDIRSPLPRYTLPSPTKYGTLAVCGSCCGVGRVGCNGDIFEPKSKLDMIWYALISAIVPNVTQAMNQQTAFTNNRTTAVPLPCCRRPERRGQIRYSSSQADGG